MRMDNALLIAGVQNPVLVDYAMHCLRRGCADVSVVCSRKRCRDLEGRAKCYAADSFSPTDFGEAGPSRRIAGVVLFLDGRWTRCGRALVDAVAALAAGGGTGCVCVVSSFRVHLGDRDAAHVEASALEHLRGLPARIVVLRPSHVLSRRSPLAVFLGHGWYWLRFVPGR